MSTHVGSLIALALVGLTALGCQDEPRARILSPPSGQQFALGDTVHFNADVNSPYPLGPIDVDGDWRWTSDLDGLFGTRARFDYADLTVGVHLITLRVRNEGGATLRDQISLRIVEDN